MLKKISMILMLNMIMMQNSFAMERDQRNKIEKTLEKNASKSLLAELKNRSGDSEFKEMRYKVVTEVLSKNSKISNDLYILSALEKISKKEGNLSVINEYRYNFIRNRKINEYRNCEPHKAPKKSLYANTESYHVEVALATELDMIRTKLLREQKIISESLIKVQRKIIANQVLINEPKKIIAFNNTYHEPTNALAGINLMSLISDAIYQQRCSSQDSDSYSYHNLPIDHNNIDRDSLDSSAKFWISEDSSDSSMKFYRSDEELSDTAFLLKRPHTKNGSRIIVLFKEPSRSTSSIFEKEETIIDGYNMIDMSFDQSIRFGRNRDGSSEAAQDLVSLIDRFYHHQYRYYTNKYGYYNKLKKMLAHYICISEYVLKLKEQYSLGRNEKVCLDEILYKGMLLLKSIIFQNMLWQ